MNSEKAGKSTILTVAPPPPSPLQLTLSTKSWRMSGRRQLLLRFPISENERLVYDIKSLGFSSLNRDIF